MQIRKLDGWEKDLIRNEIQSGIRGGKSDAEMKEIRKELALLLECGIAQVSAVSAWKKDTNGLVLQSSKDYQFPEDNPDSSKPDTQQNIVPAISTGDPNEGGPDQLSERGEHMDYDFPVKIRWRQKWSDFIASHTQADQRSNLKVLCLPGKQCLEIPLYLQLGIKPENIVGVEGGDAHARREFIKHAQQYGIQYELGRLEKMLQSDGRTFDIVSLDFNGQCCETHFAIIRKLRLRENSLVLINQQAKRETPDIQSIIYQYNQSMTGALGSIDAELENVPNESTVKPENVDLSDIRNESGTEMMVRNMGSEAPENIRFPDITRRLIACDEAMNTARYTVMRNAYDFYLSCGNTHESSTSSATFMKFMIDRGFQGACMPTALEQYEYKSPKGSPFNSGFLAIHRGSNEIHDSRYSLEFLLKCTLLVAEKIKSGGYASSHFQVRDKRMVPKKGSMPIPSDHLCFHMNDQLGHNIPFRSYQKGQLNLLRLYEEQVFQKEFEVREKIE